MKIFRKEDEKELGKNKKKKYKRLKKEMRERARE